VRPSRHPAERPILITEAPVNADEEFEHRRKRYLLMMTLRAVCIIGAASTFSISGWIAAAFVAAALVLPWTAVLIANDRPPKQELRFRRFVGGGNRTQRQLTSGKGEADADQRSTPPTIIDL
jgi:Flp pilus assembly protein TadB